MIIRREMSKMGSKNYNFGSVLKKMYILGLGPVIFEGNDGIIVYLKGKK